MNDDICKYIQSNIDKLCQTEIDEIFKILYKHNCAYTQNNNGVFVNLNWLDDKIITEIKNYITFCLQSQNEINKYEKIKNTISDSLINKEKLEDEDDKVDEVDYTNTKNVINKQQKVSSSLKFYLLKKKFQKKYILPNNNYNNSLTHEEYIL